MRAGASRSWKFIIGGLAAIALAGGLFLVSRGGDGNAFKEFVNDPRSVLPVAGNATQRPCETDFAVIGDYGLAGKNAADVATLVARWEPDFIVTTGDNNYPDGEAETIDENIGQYYHAYIHPYAGSYGEGADANRFFPVLGNHDWHTNGAKPYLDYFSLPGNERYYDVVIGPVHLFAIDSSATEPDGVTARSAQASWLQAALRRSRAPWKIVVLHHPPYSSGSNHGSEEALQWPFKAWGADAVLAGHDHLYERLQIDELPYLVNGLGGNTIYGFGPALPGSVSRYREDYGALRAHATAETLALSFVARTGDVVDAFTIEKPASLTACGPLLP